MHPVRLVPARTDTQTMVAALKTCFLRDFNTLINPLNEHDQPGTTPLPEQPPKADGEGIYKCPKGVSTRSVPTRYDSFACGERAREGGAVVSVVRHRNCPQTFHSLVSLRVRCVEQCFERFEPGFPV